MKYPRPKKYIGRDAKFCVSTYSIISLTLIISLISINPVFSQEKERTVIKKDLPPGIIERLKVIPIKPEIFDQTPPEGTIVINNNEDYTDTTEVTLDLSASDPYPKRSRVTHIRLANDSPENWSTEEVYQTTKQWSLSQADGQKTVYVQFKDVAGNWSEPFPDTIILDTQAPVVEITFPEDGAWVGRE